MKVREPVARPLDVVAVELLLTASQAFLAGVLLYLAAGFWEDLGVTLGSVAAILVLMGLTVGGAWLYWLLGGVGWPMAAANTVSAVFLGALLVLGWAGETFNVSGVPLLIALAAAVFGVVAGVFLESPRRWPWNQREKHRPGTSVPRVSPTTRAVMAQVPHTLPQRAQDEAEVSDLAARIEQSSPAAGGAVDDAAAPLPGAAEPDDGARVPATVDEGPHEEPEAELTEAPAVKGAPIVVPQAPEPTLPTDRLSRAAASETAEPEDDEDAGVELPTMVEPKAQRSPWAWAAPPQWNRDEDDESADGRPSGKS